MPRLDVLYEPPKRGDSPRSASTSSGTRYCTSKLSCQNLDVSTNDGYVLPLRSLEQESDIRVSAQCPREIMSTSKGSGYLVQSSQSPCCYRFREDTSLTR